jgi:rhodanese-related sulfurtransferase
VALLLRRRGIARVRPLTGGFLGWRDAGFPLEGAPGPPVS